MSQKYFEHFTHPLRGIDTSAALLKRLYLVEREIMRSLGGWHLAVTNWELKVLTPRHTWHASLHANVLRERVLELRFPKRDVDADHEAELVAFLGELTKATTDAEFALGVYDVVVPALMAAFEAYLVGGDELDDAPSFYQIEHILLDERKEQAEARAVIGGLGSEQRVAAQPWVEYLQAYLEAIGGILGDAPRSEPPSKHPCAGRPAYTIPQRAQRDLRFHPATVESPMRPPRNTRERQVWFAIDHANEIWAAEMPGAFMWAWTNMPWAFYMDAARWGYDEQRHSAMGIRRLEAWGFEMGVDYPMVGDPYHAIVEQGHGLDMVLALLYYFERDAPAYKQQVKKQYDQLGDVASAQDTDFDWADEAIHLRYGYTWLQHLLGPEAKTRMSEMVKEAGALWDRWLAERWERGEDDYGPYMERIDARIAQAEARAT